MDYDPNKVDEAVLALLYLTSFTDRAGVIRAWKGLDWDAMDRLYDKGYIGDPKSKAKSIMFTEEGYKKSKVLFEQLFGVSDDEEQDSE